MITYARTGLVCVLVMALGACSTMPVGKSAIRSEKIITGDGPVPEALLLDVGIDTFDPGVAPEGEEGVYPQIREAESRYIPIKLMETLQHTGQWGAVRVIPDKQSETDVWIDGEILQSDGEKLALKITVRDSSGKKWYSRRYEEVLHQYSYEDSARTNQEPFQNIYNKIANDLLKYRKRLAADDIKSLRVISELKFAARFSPEAFSQHLDEDNRGRITVKRLPADNDPILQRIRKIRKRDNAFVDTLQDYYDSFGRQMQAPYREWRRLGYEEIQALDELNRQKWVRGLVSALVLAAGVAAQGSDSQITRSAGVLGIGAGVIGLKSAYDKGEEAKIHEQSLEELGQSLNTEIAPRNIELEGKTVTLTGSANEQYAQWRRLLRDIYQKETGQLEAKANVQ